VNDPARMLVVTRISAPQPAGPVVVQLLPLTLRRLRSFGREFALERLLQFRKFLPQVGADRHSAATTPAQPKFGALKVVTTRMRPGYLRKNGVPYSANAVLTEYWDLHKEPSGVQWLVITSIVDDPKYLVQPYITSPNFRREADGSKWDPTPCSATW